MKEYRVINNYYQGKGDEIVLVTTSLMKALEEFMIQCDFFKNHKGKSWIEVRKVSEWSMMDIESEVR